MFTQHGCEVEYNGEIILQGWQDNLNNLWHVPLQTTTTNNIIPPHTSLPSYIQPSTSSPLLQNIYDCSTLGQLICFYHACLNDSSNFIWSFFLREKSNLADIMLGLMKNLKKVIIYRYNTFQKACKQEGLGFTSIYSPRYTKQNICIKRKFSPLFNQVHAISLTMVNSKLIYKMVYGLKLQTLPCFLKTIC